MKKNSLNIPLSEVNVELKNNDNGELYSQTTTILKNLRTKKSYKQELDKNLSNDYNKIILGKIFLTIKRNDTLDIEIIHYKSEVVDSVEGIESKKDDAIITRNVSLTEQTKLLSHNLQNQLLKYIYNFLDYLPIIDKLSYHYLPINLKYNPKEKCIQTNRILNICLNDKSPVFDWSVYYISLIEGGQIVQTISFAKDKYKMSVHNSIIEGTFEQRPELLIKIVNPLKITDSFMVVMRGGIREIISEYYFYSEVNHIINRDKNIIEIIGKIKIPLKKSISNKDMKKILYERFKTFFEEHSPESIDITINK
jgi:hypothetical protein